MTFEELGVRDDLLRGIADMGFETPMPVQEKSTSASFYWRILRNLPDGSAWKSAA